MRNRREWGDLLFAHVWSYIRVLSDLNQVFLRVILTISCSSVQMQSEKNILMSVVIIQNHGHYLHDQGIMNSYKLIFKSNIL